MSGQVQFFGSADPGLDEADHDGHVAALAENVDAEIPDAGGPEREIHFHLGFEFGDLFLGHHLVGDALDDIAVQDLRVDRHRDAFDLDVDRGADGKEQVGSLFVGGELQ